MKFKVGDEVVITETRWVYPKRCPSCGQENYRSVVLSNDQNKERRICDIEAWNEYLKGNKRYINEYGDVINSWITRERNIPSNTYFYNIPGCKNCHLYLLPILECRIFPAKIIDIVSYGRSYSYYKVEAFRIIDENDLYYNAVVENRVDENPIKMIVWNENNMCLDRGEMK